MNIIINLGFIIQKRKYLTRDSIATHQITVVLYMNVLKYIYGRYL